MTDPTKALADAARKALVRLSAFCFVHQQGLREERELSEALAAYDAAQATEQVPPTDEQTDEDGA